MLTNIPIELRQLKQWVNADMSLKENGDPKKTPLTPKTGAYASVTDSNTWGTFDEAVATGKPVGFVLTKDDPYCIIDLDDKESNPASAEEKQRFTSILNQFATYSEISNSGRGAHLILRGVVPKGINKSHVEVYSEGRYMICTGRVLKSLPIEDRQDLLNIMYGEMTGKLAGVNSELAHHDVIDSDLKIMDIAENAANAAKFTRLWKGNWDPEYPSQSEADFALCSMLCFYTKNNDQVIRLFRESALGKREKAQRDDYFIGKYGILNKIRASEVPTLDFTALTNTSIKFKKEVPQVEVLIPDGLIGDLTDYFLATAMRPVKEIALAAALALVAGCTGRSYNTPTGAGLNLYIILLAKTGSGKDGIQSGIEKLLRAVKSAGVPMVEDFVGPAVFSSGQALIKVLNTKPCFFSVLGEFGHTLQELSDPRSTSSTKNLKRVLLDLYGKSGASDVLRSSVYSDTDKNTAVVQSPAVTILGESTPSTFFESLNESQITDGLIPRFSIIQYHGKRPPPNENANCPPPEALVAKFTALLASSLTAINNNTFISVQINDDAKTLLDKFSIHADKLINENGEGSVEVELWNRAHLKALKLASIIAVGNHPTNPIIDIVSAAWAVQFVNNDINLISSQFEGGEMGNGDNKMISDLRKVIKLYFSSDPERLEKIGKNFGDLQKVNIIPYAYLHRLCKHSSFRSDKRGQTVALKTTVQVLLDSGNLTIVANRHFSDTIPFAGICYSVVSGF